MDILNRIVELKNEKGWSIYKLAEESGVSQSTLSNMFIRRTLPSITTLEQLCNAFGITLSDFFKENNSQKDDISTKYNMLSAENKKIVLNLVDALNKKWDFSA